MCLIHYLTNGGKPPVIDDEGLRMSRDSICMDSFSTPIILLPESLALVRLCQKMSKFNKTRQKIQCHMKCNIQFACKFKLLMKNTRSHEKTNTKPHILKILQAHPTTKDHYHHFG